MKIIKKLISFVLIVVICMGGSLVNTQNVEAASVSVYNSIESLPKNVLDNFINTLQNNSYVFLSKPSGVSVYCVKLRVNNRYYYLSEKALKSTYTYKADQTYFADYTTALVDALNYNTANADHSFYMLQRKCTYSDEYTVKLSRMSQEVWLNGTDEIKIKGKITNSLTFKYYSDTKYIKITNKTNNGLKVKPKYMLRETKTSNRAHFNSLSAEVKGEKSTTAQKIDASKVVEVLYSTYSFASSILSGSLVDATFQGLGWLCDFNKQSTSGSSIYYKTDDINLRRNGKYVYQCKSESPLYLKSTNDYYQITIGMSKVLTDYNDKMLTQFLLVPNYKVSF